MNSIFENIETRNVEPSLWVSCPHAIVGSERFAGYLSKFSKKEDNLILVQRYFVLQGDYLFYKSSKDAAKISAAMNIKFAKFEVVETSALEVGSMDVSDCQFAIKVSRGLKFSVLFPSSSSELQNWVDALTKVFIRTDIHSRFKTEKVIGKGALAQVFSATEISTGITYAVKGFSKSTLKESENGVACLWKEIEIMRSYSSSPNLVSLHEVHETKNSVYLIMELIEGGDLLSFITSEREISESTIVNIAYGILNGLVYLDQHKIFHRDIKPANIMLRKIRDVQPSDVVIVDFGLAACSTDQEFLFKRCGTPGYIAPELIALKTTEKEFKIPQKIRNF